MRDQGVGVGVRQHLRRRPWLPRAAGFIGLAVVAQLSAALPPGPNDLLFYWAGTGVLLICAVVLFLPWDRYPQWTNLILPIVYLASVCLLLLSGGTSTHSRLRISCNTSTGISTGAGSTRCASSPSSQGSSRG